MSRAVSLTQLQDEIRYRADIQTMLARHPNADLTRAINQSIQRLREKVSQKSRMFLASTLGSCTVGPLAGYSFGTIPWPATAVRIYGIDVTYQANDIRTLEYIQWNERNDFRDAYGTNNGIPVAFTTYNIGTESTNTIAAGNIAIFPAASSTYAYAIWFLPVFVDLVTGTDVWNGVDGWEEWVVWDVVKKVTARDNDMANCYAIASAEQDKVWLDVEKAAGSIQRAMPARRNDMAARQRNNRSQSFYRRP